MSLHQNASRVIALILYLAYVPAAAQDVARIEMVENGLLPPVLVAGEEVPRYSIYDRLRHYAVPGVSLAVISDGRFAWAEGYGVKQKSSTDSVHTSTVFQAASISKPVASFGALKMVEDGRLSLDGDVAPILKSWRLPGNGFTDREFVTLRRLLSHTAGLTVHGFPGYAVGETIPTTAGVLEGSGNTPRVEVDTLPGSIWRYSGGGYTVAQLLIEEVAGRPFAGEMRAATLLPLGMYGSTFEQPLPDRFADDAAVAHDWEGTPIEGSWHAYPEMAAAGLWTTPSDLVRFALEVSRSYLGEEGAYVTKSTAKDMLTPHESEDYGLGLGVVGTADSLRFSHGGANAGFRSYMLMYPLRGDGVVVMTNSDNGADLAMEIVRAVSEVYGWPDFKPGTRTAADVDPVLLRRYEGDYDFGRGFVISIAADHGELSATATRRFPSRLVPVSEREFFGTDIDMRIRFEVDDDGTVEALVIPRGDDEIRATKIR